MALAAMGRSLIINVRDCAQVKGSTWSLSNQQKLVIKALPGAV